MIAWWEQLGEQLLTVAGEIFTQPAITTAWPRMLTWNISIAAVLSESSYAGYQHAVTDYRGL